MRSGVLALLFAALAGCAQAPADRSNAADNGFQDQDIEQQAIAQINQKYDGHVYVNVTSFKRHVLLTGTVPSETDRSAVEQLASSIPNVRLVSNELEVGKTAGMGGRSSDLFVTSDVKLRFLRHGKFPTDQVRVVTMNGTVYLMGLLRRQEAASAADLASTTKGVRRVITVFEYIN